MHWYSTVLKGSFLDVAIKTQHICDFCSNVSSHPPVFTHDLEHALTRFPASFEYKPFPFRYFPRLTLKWAMWPICNATLFQYLHPFLVQNIVLKCYTQTSHSNITHKVTCKCYTQMLYSNITFKGYTQTLPLDITLECYISILHSNVILKYYALSYSSTLVVTLT